MKKLLLLLIIPVLSFAQSPVRIYDPYNGTDSVIVVSLNSFVETDSINDGFSTGSTITTDSSMQRLWHPLKWGSDTLTGRSKIYRDTNEAKILVTFIGVSVGDSVSGVEILRRKLTGTRTDTTIQFMPKIPGTGTVCKYFYNSPIIIQPHYALYARAIVSNGAGYSNYLKQNAVIVEIHYRYVK